MQKMKKNNFAYLFSSDNFIYLICLMLKLLFLLLLLTLAICGHGQTKERKKQKKELIRKQKEMEDALKDVDPDDITGWSV
jgi:hypothetical protein